MRKSSILSVMGVALLFTACAETTGPGDGLLESMPANHDIYLTFDPDDIGISRILSDLAASPLILDGDLDQVRETLGFNPLDWDGWVEALALEPGREMGFIVDGGGDDVALICLYVPSSDHGSVKEFFTRITEDTADFRGELEFTESEGYVIVLIAETHDIAAHFDPDADKLGSDPDLARLTIAGSGEATDASLYIRFADLMEDEMLHSSLFEMKGEGSKLELRLAVYTTDHDVIRFSSFLTSSQSGMNFRLSENTSSVLRLTLGMEALKGFIVDQGIDREFEMGIEEFGFASFIEFLDTFSGDVCISYDAGNEQYSATVQFGLNDPQAITDLLVFLRNVIAGTEREGMNEFDLDGEQCYRIETNVAPGMGTVEYGVVNGTLMIAGGCTLRELVDGTELEDYTSEHGMGIGPDHGILFISDMEMINEALGFSSGATDPGDGEAPVLNRLAASLDADNGLLELVIILEATGGDPFPMATELLAAVILDMLASSVR